MFASRLIHRTCSMLSVVLVCAAGSAAPALAATYSFPGGPLPGGCSASGNVVNCGSVSLGNNDVIVASPVVTWNVVDLSLQNKVEVNVAGAAEGLQIVATGTVSIGNNFEIRALIEAGGGVSLGNNGKMFGNITAGGTLTIGNNSVVYGHCIPPHERCQAQVSAPEIDHLRIEHSGNALTCLPTAVTLRACMDADCNTVFGGTATASLLPAGSWRVGGTTSDTVTFDHGVTSVALQHTTPGPIIVGGSITSPGATNPTRCFNGAVESCALIVSEAGFVVDVPNLIAGKPSSSLPAEGPVTLRAVKADPLDPASCAPAFTGPRQVRLWTDYESPNTGALPVHLDGSPVASSAPGTLLTLDFDATATATIASVRYLDAGQLRLNARFEGVGDEAGLVLEGSDLFVSRPLGLAVLSTAPGAECASGDHTCPAFRRADQPFDLTVRGVAWTHEGDVDLNDNPVTPNYRQNGITLGHQLIAPLPGSTGMVGRATVDIVALGEETVAQDVSEVGVFRFTARPPTNGYFGHTVPGGESAPIGRFTPDHFTTGVLQHGALPALCFVFAYTGQPIDGWAVPPALEIVARNLGGGITRNYVDDFARLSPVGLTITPPVADDAALGADGLTPLAVSAAMLLGSLAQTAGGEFRYTFAGSDSLVYPKQPNARIGPFAAQLTWNVTGVIDADSISATDVPTALNPAGIEMRFGRLGLVNRHGAENAPLEMLVRAEYFGGSGYLLNPLDECTAVAMLGLTVDKRPVAAGTIPDPVPSGLLAGIGALSFACSAVSVCGPGYADITADLSLHSWLRDDRHVSGVYADDPVGRATFGVHPGRQRILFQRELLQ